MLREQINVSDLSESAAILSRSAEYARSFLGVREGELFLTGGFLRDMFLGRDPSEADLVYFGDSEGLAKGLADHLGWIFYTLDEERGIHRLIPPVPEEGLKIDIAAPRGDTIDDDLRGRDFTVNAMGIDIVALLDRGRISVNESLEGPREALEDLEARCLRLCREDGLEDDPLRAVRAVRLNLELDFEYEKGTESLLRVVSGLESVPGERLWREMGAFLVTGGSRKYFSELRRLGLLSQIFPGVEGIYALPQNYYHHLDVWEHTMETLGFLDRLIEDPGEAFPGRGRAITESMESRLDDEMPRAALLRLAGLLHDVGKSERMSVEESGRIRFIGHQEAGRDFAKKVAGRLRLGRKSSRYLLKVVGEHMRLGFLLEAGDTVPNRLRAVKDLGDVCLDVVVLSLADRMATRGEASTEEAMERFRKLTRRVVNDYFWLSEEPEMISGHELMLELGLSPGPQVGALLFKLRIAQREGLIRNREDALNFINPRRKGQGRILSG